MLKNQIVSSANGEKSVNVNGGVDNDVPEGVHKSQQVLGDKEESGSTGRFKDPKIPQSGGSFLCLMEEVVKVGNIMGYNMEGVINNLSQIIETHGESMVNR
ncbi:hypothetical protein Tco_0172665 [Tanacetum coccineum]